MLPALETSRVCGHCLSCSQVSPRPVVMTEGKPESASGCRSSKKSFLEEIRTLARDRNDLVDNESMLPIAIPLLWYLRALLQPRHNLALEIAALRQQLAVFKRKQPRPPMRNLDRLFWIVLSRFCPSWSAR
jgi:hypothetical protein